MTEPSALAPLPTMSVVQAWASGAEARRRAARIMFSGDGEWRLAGGVQEGGLSAKTAPVTAGRNR